MDGIDSNDLLTDEGNPEGTHNACDECKELLESNLLYCCFPCSEGEEETCKRSFICSTCITPHAKKNHVIIDMYGHEVSLCEKHKSVNELYCVTCVNVICILCALAHKNHEVLPIEQKSTDVKKEVFKYINDFDSLTKDVKYHQHRQKISLDALKLESEVFRPGAIDDTLLQFVSEVFTTVAKSRKMSDLKKKNDREISKRWTRTTNGSEVDKI